MNNNFIITIPPRLHVIITNKKNEKLTNLFLYNNVFILKIINIGEYNFDIETNSLLIKKYKINNINIKNFEKFLKSWDIYFYYKIKFKGKGYRIRFFKKNKIMKFYFGKSHITVFKFRKIQIKKIGKYKFLIKNLDNLTLKNTALNVVNIKPINIYTLRGLRLSRQVIFKRKGKKGSYI